MSVGQLGITVKKIYHAATVFMADVCLYLNALYKKPKLKSVLIIAGETVELMEIYVQVITTAEKMRIIPFNTMLRIM